MSVYVSNSDGLTVKTNIIDNLRGIEKRTPQAQFWLDGQVMNDCVPLMPRETGSFINQTKAISASLQGTGMICVAGGVQGRYLYEGKVMVDAQTGSGARPITLSTGEIIYRHRLGAKLVPTSRPLTYSNPSAVPHWYEVAKENHFEEWKKGALSVMRGKNAN